MAAAAKPGIPTADTASSRKPILIGLVEELPVGIVLLSEELKIAYANGTAGVLCGVDPAELLDRSVESLVHAEDRDLLRVQIALARLARSPAAPVDVRLERSEGVYAWTQVNFGHQRSLTARGELIVTLVDVDQRKRSETDHRTWEERWNSALVSSTLGVWDHDFRNGTMYYSDTWKKIRGMDPEDEAQTTVESWIESVHPDDRDHVLDHIRRQNDGDPTANFFEYRERRKDGSWIWIECRGSCIDWFEDGKPARIVGTDLDITERKETEEKLALTQQRLELALNVTNVGVFEANIQEGTLLMDDRLLAIMGLTGEPNLQDGQAWLKVIHPEDLERARAQMEKSTNARVAFSNQFRIIKPDGGIRHIRARAAPFTDNYGNLKYIGANWDVTEDIVIREELERAKALAEARNQELEAARAQVEHNALHDFLTDLPNRRYLDAKLTGRDPEAAKGLAILHIDLDRFKEINDTLGHKAGDHMLLHAAEVLRRSVGPDDFVARIGGDEFVILSDFEGNTAGLSALSERIIRRMRDPILYNGTVCRVGASIGIACDPRPEVDAKQLLLNADIALYRAKSLGRNRYDFFSIDFQHQVVNTKRVADEILTAIEREEFVPYYQLQFSAKTLQITGAETLARWRHPEKGILGPDAFLTVAEDLDVMAAIDAMIFEKALADFNLWREVGIEIPKVAVNVSTRRLYDADLIGKLSGHRFEPGTVAFELLESIFLDDGNPIVLRNIEALRQMGIGIEIDDFGTGHASIVSLLKVGPGTLKIDRELVMPITEAEEQRKLVGSIIEIGRSLNIRVVAEGVETRDHVRILQDLGCDILQGYALARPMPFKDIGPFVAAQSWRRQV